MKKTLTFILLFTSILVQCKELNIWDNELTQLINKADSLGKKKQYKNALEIYNEALGLASQKNKIKDTHYINKKVGFIYYKQKDYPKAKLFFRKNIDSGNASATIADSYLNLSLIYRKEQQLDSTLWCLKHSLHIYDQLEDSDNKFATYLKAGIIYKQKAVYNSAMKYLLLAYKGFEKNNNSSKKASACHSIGEIQKLLGNYEMAKRYLKQSLDLRIKLRDSLKISYAYNNLGNLFKSDNKYDSAIVYYKKAIQIQSKLKRKKEIGRILYNMGLSYFSLEQYTLASHTFKESINLKKTENDTLSIAFTYNELALSSLKESNLDGMRKYLDSSKRYLSEISKNQAWLRNYEIETYYYEYIGDYKKALEYQQKLFSDYKESFSKEQSEIIQKLQEEFQSQLKDEQINVLNTKDSQNKTTIKNQQKSIEKRNLILLMLFVVILFLLGVYYYIKQKQQIKIQQIENEKLKDILKGQEEIKEHISHDLHDIVTTSYEGIRLKIIAFLNSKSPEAISKSIINDIKNVNHEVRLISHRLSPLGNKIKDSTLTEIIISELSEFQLYRKIFIDIQLPLPDVLNQLNLETQTNFYGIFLEVLNNIEKHAKANEIKIVHSYKNDQLFWTISDNGMGMINNSKKGIGLKNMRQRTKLLNGKLNIYSNEKGTFVSLSFPTKKILNEKEN